MLDLSITASHTSSVFYKYRFYRVVNQTPLLAVAVKLLIYNLALYFYIKLKKENLRKFEILTPHRRFILDIYIIGTYALVVV